MDELMRVQSLDINLLGQLNLHLYLGLHPELGLVPDFVLPLHV